MQTTEPHMMYDDVLTCAITLKSNEKFLSYDNFSKNSEISQGQKSTQMQPNFNNF